MEQLYSTSLVPSSRREIRLLELLSDGDSIECRLHLVTISDGLQFSALSYVWGDASDTTDITVDGIRTPVTRNLAAALRYVRKYWRYEFPDRPLASLRLWVDALCINQADLLERREQVKLIPDIYSSAELVLAWLGDEDPVALMMAASTIKILSDGFRERGWDENKLCDMNWIAKYPSLITPPECDGRWKSISYLTNLPYWKRVWVLQENTLAGTLFYISPNAMIEQGTLMVVCALFQAISSQLSEGRIPRPKFIPDNVWLAFNPPKYTSFIQWESIMRLVVAKSIVKAKTHGSASGRKEPDLTLSELGGTLHATDPKDHIYGLLGISFMQVEVDYSNAKSLKDVYVDYTRSVLDALRRNGSRNFTFFRDGGIGVFDNKASLPSWAPNYPERAVGEPSLVFDQRNSLVSLAPEDTVSYPTINQGHILSIAGVALTSVVRLSKQPPTIKNLRAGGLREWCQDYLRRYPRYPADILPPLWALFMTVMRLPTLDFETLTFLLLNGFILSMNFEVPETKDEDKTAEPCTIPPAYVRTPEVGGISVGVLCDDGKTSKNGNNNPQMFVSVSPAVSPESLVSGPQSLKERLLEVDYRLLYALKRNHNTALFETKEGYLGLGPIGSAEGDVVCLIDGYKDLVLLRPQCGTGHYQYVGPCLVPGLPGGDDHVKQKIADGTIKIQMFDLV